MTEQPIRVLIVDDQNIVRQGTHALLAGFPEIQVVGEATNGQEAITLASALNPDVILMDLVMPKLDGVNAMRAILARQPGMRIIALTSYASDEHLLPAVRAGALGYFLKDETPQILIQAIQHVSRGGAWLPPHLAQRVLQNMNQPVAHFAAKETLTERELAVLRELARGKSNAEIAAALDITDVTVRSHISHILSKLGAENRVQAALYALREGIVTLES